MFLKTTAKFDSRKIYAEFVTAKINSAKYPIKTFAKICKMIRICSKERKSSNIIIQNTKRPFK